MLFTTNPSPKTGLVSSLSALLIVAAVFLCPNVAEAQLQLIYNSNVDLGSCPLLTETRSVVTIVNTGTSDVTLEIDTFQQYLDNQQRHTQASCLFDYEEDSTYLLPGDSVRVHLSMTCYELGARSVTLTIQANPYTPGATDLTFQLTGTGARSFLRGDTNGDGRFDLSDNAYLISFLFQGGPPPPCMEAADFNKDGHVRVNDAIAIVNNLTNSFYNPAQDCEIEDPSKDTLGCDRGCGE